MKGLLIYDGLNEQILTFVCDVCHKDHSIYIAEGEPYQKEVYNNFNQIQLINVWGYQKSGESIIIDQYLLFDNLIMHPSFDNSAKCGFHSSANWKCEVKVVKEDQFVTPELENWLHN